MLRSPKVAKPQVEAAFDAFTRACNPLFTVHASDIVKIRASAGEPYGQFRVDQWGWGGEVHLTVTLNERTTTFPAEARANGHTLHYFLGGGRRPGAQVQKRISELACGLLEVPGRKEDAFMTISELGPLLPNSN